ncbi:hypothetical protein [Vibrio intestinalis]|uniref:hypothetical protein n=1 Tax=Vibrio intestinalis TaxID=2933291 RepID=UPI0021A7ABE8|nr:hypothetical protein [Vibrio intestinalis]
MSKLWKLKSWLSLDEGANMISTVLGEPVEIKDLYRFALDGHLNLSVNFVNLTPFKKVTVIKAEDVQYKTITCKLGNPSKTLETRVPLAEHRISKSHWVKSSSKECIKVKGIYELAMIGAERREIEQLIYPELDLSIPIFSGCYIKDNENIYQLQSLYKPESTSAQIAYDEDPSNSKPRRLPHTTSACSLGDYECDLVLRTSEVTRFIQALQDEPSSSKQDDKPLGARERNTLLTLIGALCNQLDINPTTRGVTTSIQAMTELVGAPLSDDSIRNILSQVPTALEKRQK